MCEFRKKFFFVWVFIFLIVILPLPADAFTGRDGDQIVTCTKLTEPLYDLNVATQGGTNYGKYYVQTITGGANFYLYDIELNELLAVIPLESDGSIYKNNNANFGTEYYSTSDILPLLYVSSAYDYEINVFRIYQENNVWKAMTVQTISYPTIDNDAGYYSCNVLLDNANGYLYLTPLSYNYKILENEQHFFRFNMPELADGNIELTIDDALYHCSVWDYIFAPQGAIIMNNKMYQMHGIGNAFLRVFDLEQERYVKTYKLFNYGYNVEPESIGFYNGEFYSMDVSLQMWKISIEDAETLEQQVGTSKTVTLLDWEIGTISSATGNESTSTKIARTTESVFTLGSDKLIINTPTHYSGISDGSFYKWRVFWYDGDTFLGLASEQCDYATFTEFDVPNEADSFRITIADVYRGITEQNFGLTTFINNGGLTVQLFTVDDTPSEPDPVDPIDTTELKALIEEVEGIDLSKYTTEETVAVLEGALEAAKEVLNDADSTQTEVDEAVTNLKEAKAGLEEKDEKVEPDPVDPIDTTELKALIEEVEELDLSKYTEKSVAVLEEALEKVNEVLNDADATQTQVDEAVVKLAEAKEALVEIDDSGDDETDSPETGEYTNISLLVFALVISAIGVTVLANKRKRIN